MIFRRQTPDARGASGRQGDGTPGDGGDGTVSRLLAGQRPKSRLRIAQVAPLAESVPPARYGGTERVVSWLTEALVARGHDVTLFASGDSVTGARLQAGCPQALRPVGLEQLGSAYQLVVLDDVYEHADEFDVIHTHLDFWSFPFARKVRPPSLSTMHGRLDMPALFPIYQHYRQMPLVSISAAQRAWLPRLNWVATVHHGMPSELLRFSPGPGRYLAFLGRISPEKRPDLAIEIARRAGIPLKIAAKVDPADRDYYEAEIKHLITPPDIEYIGEISDAEKSEFLGAALALLFPIDWPEPFGLAVIEALACGTPVIARPCGSVPELIRHGVTGWMATELDELVAGTRQLEQLSRVACRRDFEARFSAERMTRAYEATYERLIAEREEQLRLPETPAALADAGLAAPSLVHAATWHPDAELEGRKRFSG